MNSDELREADCDDCCRETRWRVADGIDILVIALEQIARGAGRYDQDALKHAENTIEDMKELATIALKTVESGQWTPDLSEETCKQLGHFTVDGEHCFQCGAKVTADSGQCAGCLHPGCRHTCSLADDRGQEQNDG